MREKKTRKLMSVVLVITMIISMFSTTAFAKETSNYGNSSIMEIDVESKYGQTEGRKMYNMVNDFRTGKDAWQLDENGNKVYIKDLKPLKYDYGLEQAATLRALESAISFSHERPNGESCFTVYEDVNCVYINGENIAAGYNTAQETFVQWQETDKSYNGQGHRRNMLNPNFESIGIGHVIYDGMHFWAQSFSCSSTETGNKVPAKDDVVITTVQIDKGKYTIDNVSCDKEELNLKVNETCELPSVVMSFHNEDTFYVNPKGRLKNVSWTVSDKNIAEIVNNTVKAKKSGQTVINPSVSGFDNIKGVKVNVACEHKKTSFVKGNPATCTEDGIKDYYYCEGCGKKFLDKECKKEVTDKDLVIKAIGHNYGDWIVDKQPTETDEGHKYKECANCGDRIEETIPVVKHEHKVVLKKGNPATCTEDGIKDYYYCEGCGKKFLDKECKKEVTDKDLVIKATGHNYGDWIVDKQPTETDEGHKYKECANCGDRIEESISKIPVVSNKWIQDGNKWQYLDENGKIVYSTFKYINGIWYYFNDSGYMVTGWQYINGTWYYFNGSGYMMTGWQYINGTWYYFNDSGYMVTGWQYINGTWYYFNGSGHMMTGWQYINGIWYYFNGSGYMMTGWQYINGTWYYFNGSGHMMTGWQYINGIWYYFDNSGAMI